MHYFVGNVAVFDSLDNHLKDGQLVVSCKLIVVLVQVVHERHVHELCYEADEFIAFVVIMQFQNILVIQFIQNASFPLNVLAHFQVYSAPLVHFDRIIFTGLAMPNSLDFRKILGLDRVEHLIVFL